MHSKYFIIALLWFLAAQGCAQKQTTVDMDVMTNQAYESATKYKEQPIYGVQVNKSGCNLTISVNDRILRTYFGKGGFSMTETFNSFILKSGEQKLKIMVYPREGMTYIDDIAHIRLGLFYVKQKGDPIDEYQSLATIELPEDLKDKKLPYFEMEIPFEAIVPWDNSAFYDNLTDLRKVPNIEEKVLLAYEKVRETMVNNDQQTFSNFILKNAYFEYEALYMTKEEIKENMEFYLERVSPQVNKEVFPISKDYELVFQKEGKIVSLRNKKDRGSILKMEYGELITEGEHKGRRPNTSTLGLLLILPKGATELETL